MRAPDDAPTVTVVVPTHDRPQLLAEAVASVQRQTMDDWELVVVDDASQPAVDAARFADLGRRLQVVRNAPGAGGAASKTVGAGRARGRLVAFLDDDDLFAPELLARAVAVLDAQPSIEVLFLSVRWFGADAAPSAREQAEAMQRVLRTAPPVETGEDVLVFDGRLVEGLLVSIPMDFQRVIVRREALDRVGPHRADCLMWDCDWALRAALAARCALLRPRLYLQRADGQAYYSRPGRERAQIESALEITLRLHANPPPGTPSAVRARLRAAAGRNAGSLAYFHAVNGPLRSSLRAWWTSQRLHPTLAGARLPLGALAHAARRRLRGGRPASPG